MIDFMLQAHRNTSAFD